MKILKQTKNNCVWARYDFFNRPEINYVRRQKDGPLFISYYLLLASLAIEHDGKIPLRNVDKDFEWKLEPEIRKKALIELEKVDLIRRFPGYIFVPNKEFFFRGDDEDNPNEKYRGDDNE